MGLAAAAAKRSRRDSSKDDVFPSAELDWFSRNSYNVALKMCTVWKAGATLRIVQVCSIVSQPNLKRRPKLTFLSLLVSIPSNIMPSKLQTSLCGGFSVISLDAAC